MDARRLLEIVQDFKEWRGDVYKLAVLVASEQRETDAQKAEEAGQQELADLIRSGAGGSGKE